MKMTWLHMFFGLFFYSSCRPSQIGPTAETTVLLFHPLYFSCLKTSTLRRYFGWYFQFIFWMIFSVYILELYFLMVQNHDSRGWRWSGSSSGDLPNIWSYGRLQGPKIENETNKKSRIFDITSQNIVPYYRPGGDENGLKVS